MAGAGTIAVNPFRSIYREPMSDAASVTRFPGPEHDHDFCVEKALQNAVNICRQRGLRFTAQRRRILELVWASHKPVGAYDILELLARDGNSTAPPTVYRALEFLINANLVHRLDSLNAFVGCPEPRTPHAGQFLICSQCRSVVELNEPEISEVVRQKADSLGFSAARLTLEIQGLCQLCQA